MKIEKKFEDPKKQKEYECLLKRVLKAATEIANMGFEEEELIEDRDEVELILRMSEMRANSDLPQVITVRLVD